MRRKVLLSSICFALSMLMLAACSKDEPQITQDSTLPVTEQTEPVMGTVIVAARGQKSAFQVVYGTEDDASGMQATRIVNAITDGLGVNVILRTDYLEKQETSCEILVGADRRADCAALTETLKNNEYAIRAVCAEDRTKIIIAYKGVYALMSAVDRFIEDYVSEDEGIVEVPADLDVRGSFSESDVMITSSVPRLRDPCVLVEDGVYYVYGTGWECWKNTTGDLKSGWKPLGVVAEKPAESDDNYWAPEVHKYNGAYYMFTTYHSKVTGHRGCTILKSDRPEGPFREITGGHITPKDWDSIDGTFYVDPDGQPWMVFVHEWTSTDDGVGRMAAAKLSDDLTHFISEPVELFRADAPVWTIGKVTDGCWMYRCEDGQLLMLWSNWDTLGYCVGIARSASGRVDGEWTQDRDLLFSKKMTGQYDGGHGMIFTDTDGQMYLSVHSPNDATAGRKETPVFIRIREKDGTLVWDLRGASDEK